MTGLDWLTVRPIAHRGLHDAKRGIVENTAAAFTAAIANGYGIETDLQISTDGEAMVHHDDSLGRLTEGRGYLADLTAEQLKAVPFKGTADRMLTLGELCDLTGGRTPLLLELKSHFNDDTRLVTRTADILSSYSGPVAVMSFDPGLIEFTRYARPVLARGIVAQRHYLQSEWKALSASQRRSMGWMLHVPRSRPQFIAYSVRDLPAAPPLLVSSLCRLPLLGWTVRSDDDRVRAARWTDQIIFEGWRP
ncbi:MAG TPA: glycerophosphodiester phosphodiesterase family protein [Pseudolabrys sp.]|nr:glycerophosphodiester phosphodiesterase family protein [Pseudolabrys sp.]